jgi:hypothetical protein
MCQEKLKSKIKRLPDLVTGMLGVYDLVEILAKLSTS